MEKVRNYELMILIDPDVEDPKEVSSRVEEILKSQEATITNIDHWSKRKLAYPVNKKEEGYYTVYNFSLLPSRVKEIERQLKLTQQVMRYIIMCTDK